MRDPTRPPDWHESEFEAPSDLLLRAVLTLREPVQLSAEFDGRLAARLAAESNATRPASPRTLRARTLAGLRARASGGWEWLSQPRAVRLRPLTALAASGMVALLAVAARRQPVHGGPAAAGAAPAAAGTARIAGSWPEVRFVLVAPGAHRVTLVGDFNHWDPAATPLSRTGGAAWATAVRLQPGRHVYAYVVDGARWVVDPSAARSQDDDFGTPNSVITVAGGAT